MRRILDWIEDRTGYRALVHAALDERVPGGARARYVFGSVLVFLLVNQTVTGLLLAAGYAPSVNDAWASVAYIQELAPAGWFLRGMHSAGASAAIAVLGLHLMQVTWAGAYRRPREMTWWVGLVLMALLLGFGLTGYLLPWDQKGYFATQVATSLLGASPVIGPEAQRIVQGGASYGNLTLTRFYALHVLVLPGAILLFLAAHLMLFRRNGVTPPAGLDQAELDRRATTFHPSQLALDLGAIGLLLVGLILWVMRTHGASLEAPADPSSSYEARPEWYFLPLFQLLRHLPSSLELVGALGAPVVVGGLLFALPFLDRAPTTAPRARRLPIAIVAVLLIGTVALAGSALVEDGRDPAFRSGRARADREAEAARLRFRARVGAGPTDETGRLALAGALFEEQCSGCHAYGGHGEQRAPMLDGWSSRGWLRAFLATPDDGRFFGHTDIHGMKPVALAAEDQDAIIEWIWSRGGTEGADARKVARGAELFEAQGCGDCHENDGTSDGNGVPNLGGRGSADWLKGLLRDAGGPTYFGKKNKMPRFGDKLSEAEIDALVTWLRAERSR